MTLKEKFEIKGKVALITGASKGIGAAISLVLAEQGAKVVISSRKKEGIDETVKSLTTAGLNAHGIVCNIGDEAQLKMLVEETIAQFGGIDLLVNNAAANPVYGPIDQADGGVFDKIMNINLRACFLLSNLCRPSMVERGGGSIINISSVEGIKPSAGLGLYSISKAGLIMLTKTQAKEWGQQGIRSNVICPGLIKTKFSKALWSDEKNLARFTKHLALNRMAEPDEIAGLALFLASDASSYCTGSTFTADGGFLIAG
ncbi:MAG: short-chain dehydrogenase [Flammeovirgaceae bacterium TMED32]|nr:MAG: short-chain dehydrogenase [Flammeovirgaceae bacterium TMED32]|tara:strand:- start:669 stop:1442 length:774 start_codon:yes stop_codon:yes gene_type:complete